MKTVKSPVVILLSALALFAITFITGCKKDSDTDDNFQTTAEDIGQVESISTDVDNMTGEVSRTGTFTHQDVSDPSTDQFSFHSCATVTNDSVNHVLTFDFHGGCTGPDGKTRAGKVIVSYSGGGYFDPGASWVVTFDSFYVNSRHIEGTRSVINNGFNSGGNMTWGITATNMKVTRPNGTWRTWNSTRTREMTAGYGDSTWVNDQYKINGTATGTHSDGETVTCVITDLHRENDCHWITSGTIEITPSSRPVRTINFGNGTCDDLAEVTKNGVTRTIQLRP